MPSPAGSSASASTGSPLDSRIATLDVTRGVAVMGILLMNIVAFAMPFQAYMSPAALGPASALDTAVWATNFVLADGKMRGLFSLLFGASMLLVIDRAEAKGESGALTHYSRMTWLLLFGVIHAYAIWFGDILMLYAVTGMVAFLFRRMEAHKLFALGLVLVAVQVLLMALLLSGIWGLSQAATAPDASIETIEQWQEFVGEFSVLTPEDRARDLAIYQGSYATIMAERLGPSFWLPIAGNLLFFAETLGLMLLGMAGLRSGFLTGAWDNRVYARSAIVGLGIGIPLLVMLALLIMRDGFGTVALFAYDSTLQGLANLPMIMAYAAIVALIVKTAPANTLVLRIGAAGRAAFTNYLGTSIICTTIFYGYGLGLYGELSRAALYPIVFGVWVIMLLWPKPWLDRYRYGPLEWLWRSLARRELQPMRKSA